MPRRKVKNAATQLQETLAAEALIKRKLTRPKRVADAPHPPPSARLSFRYWAEDDAALAKQLWGDDRVTTLIGGPYATLTLDELAERAAAAGATEEEVEAARQGGPSEADRAGATEADCKAATVRLVALSERAKISEEDAALLEHDGDGEHPDPHMTVAGVKVLREVHTLRAFNTRPSAGGPVEELRQTAVQRRLDAELAHREQGGLQLWPMFLLDPMPEMLTKGAGHVGCAGLHVKDMHHWLHDVQMVFGSHVSRVYEMHFHLRPPFWRRGLGSEAANAVLQHAFSALRADLLLARHHPDNVACKATLKKTGFHYVGNGVYGEESQADFPTYIMTEAEFSEKVEAERALPALQTLVEQLTGIGEGSEFGMRKKMRQEEWSLRDLQRRVQRMGYSPESKVFRKAMAAPDPVDGFVDFLVGLHIYELRENLLEAVSTASVALSGLLGDIISPLLLSPDRNVAHRTLIMLQSLVEGGSTAFRRGMRTHCQEALNTALAFPTDGSRAERKTELDDVIHNHALVLLKTIAIQPNDEVEVCMPDGDWKRAKVTTVSPVEIVTTLQESSQGDGRATSHTVQWVHSEEYEEGEDPGAILMQRIRQVSTDLLKKEQEKALLAAKAAAEAAKEEEKQAHKKLSTSGPRKALARPEWTGGSNIDEFIVQHDIRILLNASEAQPAPQGPESEEGKSLAERARIRAEAKAATEELQAGAGDAKPASRGSEVTWSRGSF